MRGRGPDDSGQGSTRAVKEKLALLARRRAEIQDRRGVGIFRGTAVGHGFFPILLAFSAVSKGPPANRKAPTQPASKFNFRST
jgi:hypothetical protein